MAGGQGGRGGQPDKQKISDRGGQVYVEDPFAGTLRIIAVNLLASFTFRRPIFESLKKLDPKVQMDNIHGIITTSDGNSLGNKLISAINSRLHETKDKIVIVESLKGSHIDPVDRTRASNGSGTGSVVYINIDDNAPDTLQDEKTKELHNEKTPLEIAVGHELIHALHMANGVSDDRRNEYRFTLIYKENGETKEEQKAIGADFPYEEAKTTGLGEYKDEEFTENSLRKELRALEKKEDNKKKYDERVTY
ncbi:hypothetical protein AGMMS49579_24840 [Spirochaetia bacterium]|nr:hypothetical protein AGMMS49579_24840 [Spirochaetia bacterium]